MSFFLLLKSIAKEINKLICISGGAIVLRINESLRLIGNYYANKKSMVELAYFEDSIEWLAN